MHSSLSSSTVRVNFYLTMLSYRHLLLSPSYSKVKLESIQSPRLLLNYNCMGTDWHSWSMCKRKSDLQKYLYFICCQRVTVCDAIDYPVLW